MPDRTRGILYPARLPTFHRLDPPPAVAELVRWFWVPEWSLGPGRTSRQHVIAHPAANVVVEPGGVGFAGPTTRRSHRDLTGSGWAVGALLRPAAVPAFTDDPAAERDRYRVLEAPGLLAEVREAMAGADPQGRRDQACAALARWLHGLVPEVGEEARLANRLADVVDADPSLLRLEDVAARLGVSPRTVQRLARRYVGLTPVAMIRRRRLQEAADRVRTDPAVSLADLAAELGYADHAHLTRDFRAVLGVTPTDHRRESS